MNKFRFLSFLSLIINSLIVFLVLGSVISSLTSNKFNVEIGEVITKRNYFIFYTNLSNILVSICSALLLPYIIIELKSSSSSSPTVPSWVMTLKFIGTVSVTVTLLTVFFFLGPVLGRWARLFDGNKLFLHAVVPILAIISLICLDDLNSYINKYQALTGISTVIIYGVVYFFNVVVFRSWKDFYMFYGGSVNRLIIAFFSMTVGTVIICLGEYYLRKMFQKLIIGKNRLKLMEVKDEKKIKGL